MISIETVLILGFVALVGALIISTNLAIKLSLENDMLKKLLGEVCKDVKDDFKLGWRNRNKRS